MNFKAIICQIISKSLADNMDRIYKALFNELHLLSIRELRYLREYIECPTLKLENDLKDMYNRIGKVTR